MGQNQWHVVKSKFTLSVLGLRWPGCYCRFYSQGTPRGRHSPRPNAWSTKESWWGRPASSSRTSPSCPSSCSLAPTPAPCVWRSSRPAPSSPPLWADPSQQLGALMFEPWLRDACLFSSTQVRKLISDFAIILAILIFCGVDVLVGVETPKLIVPSEFKVRFSTRERINVLLTDASVSLDPSQRVRRGAGLCPPSEETPGGFTWPRLFPPCWSPSWYSWISRSQLWLSTGRSTSWRSGICFLFFFK